jgi:multiple sugar transport system permease protein
VAASPGSDDRALDGEELRPVIIGLGYFRQLNTPWWQITAYAPLITTCCFIAF